MKKTNTVIFKCYLPCGKLLKSKPIAKFSNQFFDIIQEIETKIQPVCYWIKQHNTETKIILNNKKTQVASLEISFALLSVREIAALLLVYHSSQKSEIFPT